MTRAVVFLTATLLFASLGAVAQNNGPSGGGNASPQIAAPSQNVQPDATTGPAPGQSTTGVSNKGIEASPSQQDRQDPRANAELPQTSTILPLLGLLGLGSLVAGLFARR